MWRFWNIEVEHFTALLESGKLDELMDELYKQFWGLPRKSQFELVRYSKKKGVFPSFGVLRDVFKVSKRMEEEYIKGEYKEFFFPVIGAHRTAELVRAIVVESSQGIFTNVETVKKHLRSIKEFLGKGFFVFFDKDFSGPSFQLSMVLNLYVKNLPSDAVFTGAVDRKGKIGIVDGLEQKRKLVESMGLRLVDVFQFENVQEIRDWYDAERYDVPLYITKSVSSEWAGEWSRFLSACKIEERVLKKLEILSSVETHPITTGQLTGDAWKEVAKVFWKRIKDTESRLNRKETWHIAINGPSSLAFAMGILFGSQKPFVLYHMQNGVYHPIEVDDVRYLKERVKEPKEVEYKLQEGNSKLVVILSLSHHELEEDVRRFVSFLENPSFLIIRHSKAGNIPVESMKEVSKEIAGLIQEIRRKRSFDEFHFFFSCPVPIAFMVGVAFGHYSQGVVYNYQRKENIYMPVFELAFLRSLREGAYAEANL